jgi:nitroimidazol reductase NimA-like FMN-containing flavoprotein (pyridoxamine 5'-phosphate oxidase superfamily)
MSWQPDDEPVTMLDEIDPAECASLLAATRYGRIAVVAEGRPAIVVLNHLLIGGQVMFRVPGESRLARLTDGYVVHASYEVDSAFPVGRSGWSVIVEGALERERDPELVTAAREQIGAWAGGIRDTVLHLRIDTLTGRRVGRL